MISENEMVSGAAFHTIREMSKLIAFSDDPAPARAVLAQMLEAALYYELPECVNAVTDAWISAGDNLGPETLHAFIHARANTMTLTACACVVRGAGLGYLCVLKRLGWIRPPHSQIPCHGFSQ